MNATPFRYADIPVFEAFGRVGDPSVYTPLPDDWTVGVADVVRSTDALKAGRYKAVNMAGAAVVSAVRNALGGTLSFPFIFGGDGAILAVPPQAAEATRRAMSATARFVSAELDLDLRVGAVTVAAIRAAGHDLRVARYAASPEAVYAMFSGGGAHYAEEELKAGRLTLDPADESDRPDLTGLSCRWSPLKSRRGVILSLVAVEVPGAAPGAFRRAAEEVIAITEREAQGGRPVPDEGPEFSLVPNGLALESRLVRKASEGRFRRFLSIAGQMAAALAADGTSQTIGRFNPRRYREWVARNSDFRKFDDALRMTVDCSPGTAAAIEQRLQKAEADGAVEFGLHRQEAALMTCIVPSFVRDDHVHFLDGADGGYAMAAQALKEKAAARRGEPDLRS